MLGSIQSCTMNIDYPRGEGDKLSASETVGTSWAAETCLGRACCSVLPPRAAVYKWAKIHRNPCRLWVLERDSWKVTLYQERKWIRG